MRKIEGIGDVKIVKQKTLALLMISIVVLTTVVVYSADAAGIPKRAISTALTFVESDLPSTTVFTDVPKTITAAITMNSLTLGGDENANSHKITNLATPASSTDAQVSNHLGLIGSLVTTPCANNQMLAYSSGSSTWQCLTPPISLTCSNEITSASASYSCTNLGAYRYYRVMLNVTGLSANGFLEMQFNGDTAANYGYYDWQPISATKVTNTGQTFIYLDDAKTAPGTNPRFIVCDIYDGFSTGAWVQCRVTVAATGSLAAFMLTDGYWASTSQINEIDIKNSGGNILANSGITVLGINSP